jgi:hypothetical protein
LDGSQRKLGGLREHETTPDGSVQSDYNLFGKQ